MSGCSNSKVNKPEDGNLEFWLGEIVDESKINQDKFIPGTFGGNMYLDDRYERVQGESMIEAPKKAILYTVTNYPDYSSKNRAVTYISITDPDITVYGLTINSKQNDIQYKMNKMGFKQDKEATSIYTKGDYRFSFTESFINFSINVTNKDGIVY